MLASDNVTSVIIILFLMAQYMYVPCQQWVGRGLFAWTLFQREWMEAWWWWKEKVIGGLTWHVFALHNTSLPQWWCLFTHSKQHIQLELHCPHCHGSCTGRTQGGLLYIGTKDYWGSCVHNNLRWTCNVNMSNCTSRVSEASGVCTFLPHMKSTCVQMIQR